MPLIARPAVESILRPLVTLVGSHPGRRRTAGALPLLAVLALALPAPAAITWNGGNGDGDFSSPANWGGTDPDTGDDGTLDDGALIFAGAVQTSVVIDIDYSGIDSIVFAGDADTFMLDGDGDGNTESLTFNDGASITNDSTVAGDMTFGSGLNLIFGGATATITNNDANGDSAIIVDSTISLAGGATALTITGAGDTTVNGVISGAGGQLVLDGAGTITLGGANTYDGGTTINAGTVLLGDAAGFGTGVVNVAGNSTIGATGGAISGIANSFLIGFFSELTIGGSENIEFAGSFSGSGSIIVDMAGSADIVTFSASSGGLLGGVTLAEGTVVVGAGDALGTGVFTVTGQDGNAILQAAVDGLTLANPIVLNDGMSTAVLDVTGANNLSLTGEISGDGDLEIGLDSGIFVTLGGANAMWSGDLIIDNAGAGVILANDQALGTGSLRLETNGQVQAAGGARTIANAIDIGATTLTIGGSTSIELSGVISGTGVVDINAAGATVTLSGTNTHTGTTTLTDGTLVLASDDALGDGGGGATFNIAGGSIGTAGATVTIDENITVAGDFAFADLADGSLTLTGTINLGDAARTIRSVADEDIILSGVISSTGNDDALIKDGDGRLILSADNSGWGGGVTLDAGSLGVGNNDALGSGGLTVGGDAELFAFGGAISLANAIDLGSNTLSITGDEDLSLTGAITESGGAGSLIINAGGTVTLTNGGNTWTGGTTIVKGDVVIGDSEALGTGDITFTGGTLAASVAGVDLDQNMVAGGAFSVVGGESLTFSGDISGGFGFTVDFDDAADTLTLSGTNSFTGDLAIAEGRVDLQNGDAVADNAAVTFAGAEAGVLVLSASETIGGLGGGDASDGVELGANTLTLAGAGSTQAAFGGVISGTGALDITGGTHLLDGANTFTGATTVSGGTLGGGGSLAGDLTIASGGTLDTGAVDAVGSFTVGGDFSLASGANWVVDISGNDVTMFDSLAVTGTGTLASGSTIDVDLSQASGTYIVTGTSFGILSADGGITNGGVTVNTDSATLQFYLLESIGVDPDFQNGDTTLSLVSNRAADAFSNPAVVKAGNNQAVGRALDQLIPIADANLGMGDAATLLAQLQVLDADDLNTALEELAPTAAGAPSSIAISGASSFASVQSSYLAARRDGTVGFFMSQASFDDPASLSRNVPAGALAAATAEPWVFGEAVRERAAADEDLDVSAGPADDTSMNVWGKLYAFQSDLDPEGTRAGYDGDFYGGQVGVDWRINDSMILGVGFGMQDSEVDFSGGRGDLSGQGFRIGPYFSWTGADWFADASISYGISDTDQSRTIAVPGQPVNTARGSFDGEDLTGYLAVGRAYQLDGGWRIAPQVSVRYSTFDFDGYTETGAGVQNMVIGDRSQDSLQTRVAVTLSRRFTGNRLSFVPEVSLGWEHEFEDYENVDAAFVVGGSPFSVDAGSPVKDALYLGLGATLLLDERFAGYVRYEGLWGDGGDTQGVTIGLNVSF
jgi:autotransporter-associated beta strand protein